MDKKDLQQILSQPYKTENWKEIVQFVFPNVSIFSSPKVIPVQEKDKEYVESFYQLGNVQLKDGKILDLLELKLKDNVNLLKNRVKLNDIVSSTVDLDRSHGVLSVFEKGTEDYRFTFSAKASEFDEEEGDFVINRTDTKRFTYLLGKNESCKTPAERFYSLSQKKEEAGIQAIEEAFSVEKLSKRFFDDYKNQYNSFVSYLLKTPSYYTAVFNEDDKKIRDFVKIFLGRIVFIKFVQKKGWMGVPASEPGWNNGDFRFLENSFKDFIHKDLFYSEFLNPLFFEALDRGDRPNDIFEITGTKVPYLSGGLFDIHDPKTRTINFPKEYFESLFDFLDRYNFTIDENDVNDQEVGIDPEMLGHIFENLLEDNKDKGAFYTPKEIVRYMCRESLNEYLKTSLKKKNFWPQNTEKAKELEEGLYHFINKREAGGIIDFEGPIAQALKKVKICDPAIGSGAFPMGLLQEIFHLMHLLYSVSPDKVGDIWELDTWRPNIVKQNIIQNSIYGVDIEKGAVDIARLRFWLSLIVDEPEPTALPHLDYKIVVGNSLLSKFEDTIIDIDWEAEDPNAGFFGYKLAEERADILNQIITKQKQAFEPESDEKRLSLEIRNLKIDLLIKQLQVMIEKQNIPKEPRVVDYQNKPKSKFVEDQKRYFETLEWKQQIQKLENIREKPETNLDYFDWKLDFPEVMNSTLSTEEGFNIVIANPPYVEHKKLKHISKDLKERYQVYTGSSDLSVYFFELGSNLLQLDGQLCYINTNKFFSTGYGKTLRKFLLNHKLINLINFEQVEVFENVLVSSVIVNLKKQLPSEDEGFWIVEFKKEKDWKKKFYSKINNARKFFYQNDFDENEWSFVSGRGLEIRSKMESIGVPLKKIKSVKIYRGITTGYDPAFIIDSRTKSDLQNAEIIRPLILGRDIKKFTIDFNNRYIINSHNGLRKKLDAIDVPNEFPLVYDHLLKIDSENEEKVRNRSDKGRHWTNLRNCAFLPLFENSKIVWPLTADQWGFALDDNRHYLTSGGYLLVSEDLPIHFILGILNSRLMRYYFRFIGIMTAGGAFTLKKTTVEKFPIPVGKDSTEIQKKVEQILNYKSDKKDITKLENDLNDLVYALYHLDYEDVLIVEPTFDSRMSREEYQQILN